MKILYIVPRFYPFKAGAETNIEAMAERLVKEGNDITVFTTNVKFRNDKLPWNEEYKGIKIRRFWAINEALYAGFYPRLLPAILNNQFDIIHVSGFGFMWVEFCLIIKKIVSRKTKFINTPHGPFMAFADSGIRKYIKTSYTQILKVILPFIYDRVISVVPSQKEWMTKEYRIKEDAIVMIPNGIDEKYIEKILPKFDPNEKIVITYLNRMEWYKGIHDVLYAMSKLKKSELEKIEFWIMGREGGYTKKLQEIIKDKNLESFTKFIFAPTDEERDQAYLKSQIHILPSKWEATGIVLIEAMAKGNVIITTNQNQGKDILINEKSGYSYDFGDVDKLTSILSELINDSKKREEMINNNHEFVKKFTWESVFPNYSKMVNDLIND